MKIFKNPHNLLTLDNATKLGNKWKNSNEKPDYFIQINRNQLHGTERTDECGLQLYDFVETILTLIFVSQKNLFSYAMTYNKSKKYTSVNKQMKK